MHAGARLGRQEGRRPLLHQLLVAPLHRALAIAEHERAAASVAEHLHLDVVRVDDRLLEVQPGVAERGPGLGRGGVEQPLEIVGMLDEAHAAPSPARRRLQQHGVAGRLGHARGLGRARQSRPGEPGTSGSPAAPIASFALALSPSTSIDSGDGPTNAMSLSKQARTNAGFSLRKP